MSLRPPPWDRRLPHTQPALPSSELQAQPLRAASGRCPLPSAQPEDRQVSGTKTLRFQGKAHRHRPLVSQAWRALCLVSRGLCLVLRGLSAPREGYNNPPISGENLIGLSRARRLHNAIFVNFEGDEVPEQPLEAAVQTWNRICTNPLDRKAEEELRKVSARRAAHLQTQRGSPHSWQLAVPTSLTGSLAHGMFSLLDVTSESHANVCPTGKVETLLRILSWSLREADSRFIVQL